MLKRSGHGDDTLAQRRRGGELSGAVFRIDAVTAAPDAVKTGGARFDGGDFEGQWRGGQEATHGEKRGEEKWAGHDTSVRS